MFLFASKIMYDFYGLTLKYKLTDPRVSDKESTTGITGSGFMHASGVQKPGFLPALSSLKGPEIQNFPFDSMFNTELLSGVQMVTSVEPALSLQ